MFPEVPFFLPRLQNVYEMPFFSTEVTWDKSNYTKNIFSIEFRAEKLSQQNVFSDFLATPSNVVKRRVIVMRMKGMQTWELK